MSLRKLCFISAFAAFSLFCSCSVPQKGNSGADISAVRDVFAMDTYMNLKAYGNNAEAALDKAEKRIYELEGELSATSETSDVWKLNTSDGKTVTVSDDTARLVDKALEMGDLSGGALDITLFPVLKAWGFTTGSYRIPDDSELAMLLEKVDHRSIKAEGNSVTLPKGTEIDFGALAKGYAGDEVMQIFSEQGVTSGIISLGGNVQALGSKPDGSDWRVAVRDPFSPEKDMCIVDISGKAVITSGNYERFFTGEDGKTYWHILDPEDGCPADNGFVSVTVIGDSGVNCDCLSTAIFVAGTEGAPDIIAKFPENDFILVSSDGKIYYSSRIKDKFENLSDMTAEVIPFD